jgi:tryptophan halogenase
MKTIKSIAIIGGGTSGWSAAAYISNNLPNCQVTVIDKTVSVPIGVGEATILSFKPFMTACGFDYWDWLNNLDTTPKSGILYPNWVRKGNEVWHPFRTSLQVVNGLRQYEMWTHNRDLDFKKFAIASYESAVINKTAETNMQAYHVDCIKMINFIKDRIKDDITYIQQGVKQINRNNTGIESVILENEQSISADLFIDCTGFSNLLTENPVKKDLYGRLFCNSAVSCHVEYNDRDAEMHPYTRAIATEIGWIWVIPIRSRIGTGLVYDKNCVTEQEAREYLANFWKDHKISDMHKHNWDPYYKEQIWQDNVVSIGLSAGFIEPLESTGLALIHLGIVRLVDKIKHYTFSELESSRYNQEMITAFEDAIDFVSTHYMNTERTEPFWQHVKNNYTPSKRLVSILENHITSDTVNTSPLYEDLKIFSPLNYTLWLEQLGFAKQIPCKLNTDLSKEDIKGYLYYFGAIVEATKHIFGMTVSEEVNTYEKYWASPFKPQDLK